MDTPVLFSEHQRFKQWWIIAILVVVNTLFIYGIVQQVVLGEPFGENPMDNIVMLIISGAMIVLTAMLVATRLTTEIKPDGIYVRLFPFHFKTKHFSWDQIDKVYIRKYSPLADYGGWGLRYSISGAGKAYIISGNMGLQLELKTGKKLLIGTQRADAMHAVLEKTGQLK